MSNASENTGEAFGTVSAKQFERATADREGESIYAS